MSRQRDPSSGTSQRARRRPGWRIDRLTGNTVLRDVEEDYRVPEHIARSAFEQLKSLADICKEKIAEIAKRPASMQADQDRNVLLIKQYEEIYTSIERKLGSFDFATFYRHLNSEIRDQIVFFKKILDAFPAVMESVQTMVREGRYPVQQFVPPGASTRIGRAGFEVSADIPTAV